MKFRYFTVIAMLIVAACGGRREPEVLVLPAPAPIAFSPIGTFDFATTTQGMAVTGAITVTPTTGGYGGTIATNLTDPIPISHVIVQGQTMRVHANTPDGPLEMTLHFTGNDFTGSWTMPGGAMTGELKGRRRGI